MAREAAPTLPSGALPAHPAVEPAREGARRPGVLVIALGVALLAGALFFLFFKLTDFPATWFDEGSHLHVPKTLVTDGVYADKSSEGYRYYGPTLGVGPTVLLPIAAVFQAAGIGLLQARLVIVAFLAATLLLYYGLGQTLAGRRVALVATLLLAFTPAVALIETGRQVLGEVPALAFLLGGLWLWFARWQKARWWELLLAGLLMGLSAVTKYQFLLVLAPALLLAWLINLLAWKRPQALFLLPGIATALSFGLWQLVFLTYLGPSNFGENLAALREVTAGAAAVFDTALMQRSLRELVSVRSYLFLLLPVLGWAAFRLVRPGRSILATLGEERRIQLTVLLLLIAANLIWYVLASVSWVRYAFVGLSLSSLFVALAAAQVTTGLRLAPIWSAKSRWPNRLLHAGVWGLLALMIAAPAARLAQRIVTAPPDPAREMAALLNQAVPPDALVETWEPHMGFLTDHTYHYPPQLLLNRAVRQVWLGETPVSELYDFAQQTPDFVLVGEFGRWVNVYPAERLEGWKTVGEAGPYTLHGRPDADTAPASE
jgi:4-amino-4-deoxy-L-arabinose transferase-like glycosyltransferase